MNYKGLLAAMTAMVVYLAFELLVFFIAHRAYFVGKSQAVFFVSSAAHSATDHQSEDQHGDG